MLNKMFPASKNTCPYNTEFNVVQWKGNNRETSLNWYVKVYLQVWPIRLKRFSEKLFFAGIMQTTPEESIVLLH